MDSCGLQSGLGVIEPSSGGVDGTAGDSTVPLISEMQESGSLEMDPSTSIQVSKETEKAATLPTESSQGQPVLMEGTHGEEPLTLTNASCEILTNRFILVPFPGFLDMKMEVNICSSVKMR